MASMVEEGEATSARQLKYLDMLEAAISRMADNQFKLRGWSVALGSAIIGFAAKDNNARVALLAVLPVVSFWVLDAYYLMLERRFRAKYNAAPKNGTDVPNFDMAPSAADGHSLREGLLRPAVWLMHLPVLLLALAVGILGWIH